MSSESKKTVRTSSPGILVWNPSEYADHSDKELKIRIHDPEYSTDNSENDDEKQFEKMKENYLKQCLPVNISIIRKSSGQDKSQADNQNHLSVEKVDSSNLQKQAIVVDRKKRHVLNPKSKTSGRVMKHGCGASGCNCINCTCEHCQVDCECMRKK